jgi:hypothetical protein
VVKAFPDLWLIEKLGEADEVAEEMAASRNSFAANSGKAVGYDPA